jgi:general secretion pathway protein C
MNIGRLLPARLQWPVDAYFWLKALLLALIGVQLARVAWALLTPVGPIGQWLPPAPQVLPAAAQTALLTSFDPFGGGGSAATTASVAAGTDEFTLFGTRAAGGGLPGSAIIAGPDGEQASVAVGEQVAPGVRLVGVGFDRVVLERSGQRLELAMAGDTLGPAVAGARDTAVAAQPAGLNADRLKENIALAPRQRAGRVTGLLVSPVGDETVMQAAGLRSGDVIVAVNGRPVGSVADASMFQAQVTPGARLALTVERGAATVPVALNLAGT